MPRQIKFRLSLWLADRRWHGTKRGRLDPEWLCGIIIRHAVQGCYFDSSPLLLSSDRILFVATPTRSHVSQHLPFMPMLLQPGRAEIEMSGFTNWYPASIKSELVVICRRFAQALICMLTVAICRTGYESNIKSIINPMSHIAHRTSQRSHQASHIVQS